MANIESRVNKFITDNEIDESFKDELIQFVNGCFTDYVSNISKHWLGSTINGNKVNKSEKVSKSSKLENPSDAKTIDDLNNCTSVILNEYCKKNGIKVGGNKKEIKERIWSHLQGESTESSVVTKKTGNTKKSKNIAHACIGSTLSGKPCGLSATEQFAGEWFCFKHINIAGSIIAKTIAENEPSSSTGINTGNNSSDPDSESESEVEQKVIKIKKSKKICNIMSEIELDEE